MTGLKGSADSAVCVKNFHKVWAGAAATSIEQNHSSLLKPLGQSLSGASRKPLNTLLQCVVIYINGPFGHTLAL